MKLPTLNNFQRIILIATGCFILAIQVNEGFREHYLLPILASLLIFIVAFSGEIKIVTPAILKTITVSALAISIIANVALFIENKETKQTLLKWQSAYEQNNYPLQEQNRKLIQENTDIIHENNLLRFGKNMKNKYFTQDQKLNQAIDGMKILR